MGVFWISKYALSGGITRIECEEPTAEHPNMLCDKSSGYRNYYHDEGRDWHRTPEAASARAETMRVAKIASLKKQIAKVEKLTFSGVV